MREIQSLECTNREIHCVKLEKEDLPGRAKRIIADVCGELCSSAEMTFSRCTFRISLSSAVSKVFKSALART